MDLEIFYPKSSLLKEYIECFYILKRAAQEAPERYFTFPSLNSILTISNADIIQKSDNVIGLIGNNPRYARSCMTFSFDKALEVNYKGEIYEITTYFKPLGIFSFLPLNYYLESRIDLNFNPFDDYHIFMESLINGKTTDRLEEYWLSKFQQFSHPYLNTAVSMILENPTIKIDAICDKLNITNKSLTQAFKKFLFRTPSSFRRIARFRKSLHLDISTKMSLTDICYQFDYYDQAHMVRDFKHFTGYTPKQFFNVIKSRKSKIINWAFHP